ncbi:MAG: hypothetical protein EOO01_00835 [Chitinophagaceae bacterium]|nr:MAG: hypothetical protein EOO01_00835 [Chitinophagaceae bacterium]
MLTDKRTALTKEYSNEEITIVWNPDRCTRSTLCWKGLSQVFNPRERPWIKPEASTTAEFVRQVEQCPSGALSFVKKNQITADVASDHTKEVTVSRNGPLLVFGRLSITLCDGEVTAREQVTAFCRCGQSGNKPFCDGTHINVRFSDE